MGLVKQVRVKHCPLCKLDLPREAFSSTRAKYCNSCKTIRQLEQQKEMQKRATDRALKKKQQKKTVITKAELKKKVQRAFNKWIRERDKDLPCISCGKHVEKYDCGHYVAQGSSGLLRYNEDNCHSQCRACNRFKHGNLINYRLGLIAKIGEDRVNWLEEHRNDVKKWTRQELEELLEKYKG